MHLSSVVIVLFHLLWVTAWAAQSRLNDKLLPRGPKQSSLSKSKRPNQLSQSKSGFKKKKAGPIQKAVESISWDDFVASGAYGRVYRLKKPLLDQKLVVKTVKVPDLWHEDLLRKSEILSLKRVQQFRGLGVEEAWDGETCHITCHILMKDMGLTGLQMLLRRPELTLDDLKESTRRAVEWYEKNYAMSTHDRWNLKNFAFEPDPGPDGKVVAHMVDWGSGFLVEGVTPIITVNLDEGFLKEERWVTQKKH